VKKVMTNLGNYLTELNDFQFLDRIFVSFNNAELMKYTLSIFLEAACSVGPQIHGSCLCREEICEKSGWGVEERRGNCTSRSWSEREERR
jgi:hypothetical protein